MRKSRAELAKKKEMRTYTPITFDASQGASYIARADDIFIDEPGSVFFYTLFKKKYTSIEAVACVQM